MMMMMMVVCLHSWVLEKGPRERHSTAQSADEPAEKALSDNPPVYVCVIKCVSMQEHVLITIIYIPNKRCSGGMACFRN